MRASRAVMAVLAVAMVGAVGLAMPMPSGAQRGARVGQAAPEITGGPWINSEPLSMAKLRGRVVLVEFWTYG
jgi:hypothetical protein